MIEVERLSKSFGATKVLDDVSLNVAQGELVALLGPSGSGKTTLLRVLAGLETLDSGRVMIDGQDATHLHPRDRRIGFVFQHYALFRHMTVADNIAFGLKVKRGGAKPSRTEANDRVETLLSLMQLDGFGDRYPSQLSGGQRQRVALARALAIDPRLLLLDEPFGALDAQVRKELRRWLRTIHHEMGLTGVFVTHDQEEALEVADRVVVMNKGAIEQVGAPTEIYDRPATPFVYRFLGNVNAIPCKVVQGRAVVEGLDVFCQVHDMVSGTGVVYIRPHDIMLLSPDHPGSHGRVRHVSVRGSVVHLEVVIGGGRMLDVETTREEGERLDLRQGSEVTLVARSARLFKD